MKILNFIKKNKLLLIVAMIYIIVFIVSPEKGSASINNSVYYLVEMLQVLPIIFLLTVVIEAWVPKEIIMSGFGEKSGIKGNLLSIVLGSISAGPIYAAFPISKALMSKGASITNIVIILSSWAVIKGPMLANEAKFLGLEFMAVRWILTVIAILSMGYLTSLIVKKKDIPNDTTKGATLEIKEEYCIGCGLCAKLSPELYEMKDNKAKVKTMPLNPKFIKIVNTTVDKCPTKAITFNQPVKEN